MLLLADCSVNKEIDFWDEDDGTGDPFLGYAYRWRITLQVQAQTHSSQSTPTPYAYDGRSVEVGHWVANGNSGRANIITAIESQNAETVVCIVEDAERFNIFSDPNMSGIGVIESGPCIIFTTGDDELPVLGPVPDFYLPFNAVNDLEARFLSMNSDEFILVRQVAHTFELGDLIYADPNNLGSYLKTDAANIGNAVGLVVKVNTPGLNYFHYRPLGSLITRVKPPLSGVHGTIFYADPTNAGKLTSTKPAVNARPIYMRLDRPDRAILIGRPAESSTNSGSETHKYDVPNVASGQTTFILPIDVREILYMSINGIENENYTFDTTSKVLVFDPVETGYGVDADDDVFFIYKS